MPIAEGRDAGDFIAFDNVPVFDAHTGDDGTEYDQHLLGCIAENQNRRIRDTGDFTPLVIGHTPDDPDSGRDPPLVGFAGPYYVGMFGKEQPRPCIFAKRFWVWKDHLDEFRANPRRSVELWPEDRPEDRYFDPISLLGAQTPRRDLGLIYSRSKDSRQPIRYELGSGAAPSGTNTFLPAGGKSPRPNKPTSPTTRKPMATSPIDTSSDYQRQTLPGYSHSQPQDDLASALKSDASNASLDEKPLGYDERVVAERFARKLSDLDPAGARAMVGGLDEEDRELMERYFKQSYDEPLRMKYQEACGNEAMSMPSPEQHRQDRYCRKATEIAYRYQRDPRKKHIQFRHILKHLIANNGKLDETMLDGD